MVSRTKGFTREFKIETVRLVTESDQTVPEVAGDLEIQHNTLYRWVKQYSQDPDEAFPGKGHQTSEAEENRRLKRDNQRLCMEGDMLKKAMLIFSKEPK